ncbi:MAG TPA: hypothetical protein VGC99_09165, partial [Candidatus Tectomicrobia bacterium]
MKEFEDQAARASVGIISEKPKPVPLFQDYAREYLKYSEVEKSLKSFQTDRGIINKYLLDAFKEKRLDEITVADVEAL